MSSAPSAVGSATPAQASGHEDQVLVDDDFTGRLRAGNVVGSKTKAGALRRGVDREGVVEIRNDALRIRPLAMPGWGRAGISYGPFERRNGLGLAIHVLNADNGSETYKLASVIRRLGRWALASQTNSLWTRLLRWPFRIAGDGVLRKLRYWYAACHVEKAYRPMHENLAVGWFTTDAPTDATKAADAFVVRGATVRNGELGVRIGDTLLPVIEWLPNVPFYYFILLRETGSAYYVASHAQVPGTSAYPALRPVAINAASTHGSLYPGLHQIMAGESGFTAETVLYRAHVARYAALSAWYGTAHAADRLTGDGPLAASDSETGTSWQVLAGNPERSADGARAQSGFSLACLAAETPMGLIHAVATLPAGDGSGGIVWRLSDAQSYLCLSLSRRGCALVTVAGGARQTLVSCALPEAELDQPMAVQIRDDGARIDVAVNGTPLLQIAPPAEALPACNGVGIFFDTADGASPCIRDFEAHPRAVALPAGLPFAPPWSKDGTAAVISDDFAAQRGDFAGYQSPNGAVWSRIMGDAAFTLSGDGGVRVIASAEAPAVNRTAFGIDWPDPDFADLTAVILPPGSARGQHHTPRGGLLFWQDDKNYFIVNNWLDNSYGGGSISCFFYFRGFEDIYDAVWTNVDDRLFFGRKNRLRVVCDGRQFRAYLDGTLVLYRAFRDVYPGFDRLRINRVGLIANWEWGRDTGSRFLSFEGLAGAAPGRRS